MGFGKHLEALVAEVDEHLGDRAVWSGVAGEVRVHPVEADDTARFGDSTFILTGRALEVHERWVATPANDDLVHLLDDVSGAVVEEIRITGDPRRSRDGWWLCTYAEA